MSTSASIAFLGKFGFMFLMASAPSTTLPENNNIWEHCFKTSTISGESLNIFMISAFSKSLLNFGK